MFEPETEDMLPRLAPKPCASVPMGHTDELIKPSVPEVSILFGQNPPPVPAQPDQRAHTTTVPQPQPPAPSFASWKKQMLPRVNFSPVLTTELGPHSGHGHAHNTHMKDSCSNEYIMLSRERNYTASLPTSRNSVGYTEPPRDRDYGRSPAVPVNNDVLTICAGTQTETVHINSPRPGLPNVICNDLDLSNLVNKQDLASVVALLNAMREEQQQLKHLCESLLKQSRIPPPPSRSTASQCEILTANNNNNIKRHTPIVQDFIAEEEEDAAPVRNLPAPFQSPRPMAQSTGYRVNTPQGGGQRLPLPLPPKANTEKSMVMNELALKYLRQPVDELMKELCVSGDPHTPTAVAPLRQIDNLAHNQSPNDISNASYKYLKKYRLLPEEEMAPRSPQNQQHQPMLDLENIRNQPKLL